MLGRILGAGARISRPLSTASSCSCKKEFGIESTHSVRFLNEGLIVYNFKTSSFELDLNNPSIFKATCGREISFLKHDPIEVFNCIDTLNSCCLSNNLALVSSIEPSYLLGLAFGDRSDH